MIRKGSPAALADEVPYDLIVMGMPSYAGLDSVAAKVARLADCQLLGVKLPAVGDAGWAKPKMLAAT